MAGRRVQMAVLAGCLGVGLAIGSPAIAVPIGPTATGVGELSGVALASFWGQPFPYGYSYRYHPCYRTERVRTRSGWRWRRVWVCL
jgi:hypothetical protein